MKHDVEAIAKVCHEANRAFCQVLGDDSQPPWEDAPQWQKESMLDGVRFFLGNPTAPVFLAHQNWMRQKEAEGWTYGEVKDPEAKTHPCMVPWSELPMEQRRKDLLFHNVAFAMTTEV